MGAHVSRHRSAGTTQSTNQLSEVDKSRERLHQLALRECKTLAHSHNVDQVNIFFIPVPGVDFHEFVRRFADTTQFPIVKAAAEDEALYATVETLEKAWYRESYNDPTSATKDILARQVQNMVLSLPRPDDAISLHQRAQGWPTVRIYTRSPVEDMYINFPLYLNGRADAGLSELVRSSITLAWKSLQCQCRPGSSVWIYLKLNEESWTRLKATHRQVHTNEATLGQWDAYRKLLNEFFSSSEFQRLHHTLTIEVHNDMLATDDVVCEVASIVAEFVGRQVSCGMWDCDVNTDDFRNHLASTSYRQHNIVHARQTEILRGKMAQLDQPTASMVHNASPLELVSSSTSLSSSVGRTSSRSPRSTLRRVHSGHVREDSQ